MPPTRQPAVRCKEAPAAQARASALAAQQLHRSQCTAVARLLLHARHISWSWRGLKHCSRMLTLHASTHHCHSLDDKNTYPEGTGDSAERDERSMVGGSQRAVGYSICTPCASSRHHSFHAVAYTRNNVRGRSTGWNGTRASKRRETGSRAHDGGSLALHQGCQQHGHCARAHQR